MVGPAVGGGLHQVGGYLLPFLVEGGVSLALCFMVLCLVKEVAKEEVDDRTAMEQVTWKKVLMAPTMILRKGSGHSFPRQKYFFLSNSRLSF